MSNNELTPEDLANLEIPMMPLEQQKQLVAEIEERIAKGENMEAVVQEVFARQGQTKH